VLRVLRYCRPASALFALSFVLCAVAPHVVARTEDSNERRLPNEAPCHGHSDSGEDDVPTPASDDDLAAAA
jgi:hypothetical protein